MVLAFQRKWKSVGLLMLAGVLLLSLWLDGEQDALAEDVLRLHVLAHSDSREDQALKLQVRDRVLEAAAPLLDVASPLPWLPPREETEAEEEDGSGRGEEQTWGAHMSCSLGAEV